MPDDRLHGRWRKSSHTGSEGNCVEVALAWRRSRRSGTEGNCVEVADGSNSIAVRDSKNPDGPVLGMTRSEWHALIDHVKQGTYDLA